MAIAYTGFCHYQFYKIEINSMEVPIKKLPKQWEGKKIVHPSINISSGTGAWGQPLMSVYLSEIVVITLVNTNG